MKSFWEKIKQINWADKRVFLIAAVVLLVFLMMDFNNRMVRSLQLEKQEQQLNARIAALEQTKQRLEADIAYANSDRAVEEWAREEAKLIKEGDVPIIIRAQSSADAAAPTPAPQAENPELSRLEIWKQLFWGE
ncbi:MAG: septum formation initiator family protein [Anaerolineaceae bacterium]|jgi:cell division protein FtsB